MAKKISLLAIIFITSACSMTLPLKGQSVTGDETFNGTATGYMNGGGDLTLVSNKGRVCNGNFVYVTSRQGEGVITCDDSQSGTFSFVSTGSSGTGKGELGGKAFTFTFGKQS